MTIEDIIERIKDSKSPAVADMQVSFRQHRNNKPAPDLTMHLTIQRALTRQLGNYGASVAPSMATQQVRTAKHSQRI